MSNAILKKLHVWQIRQKVTIVSFALYNIGKVVPQLR